MKRKLLVALLLGLISILLTGCLPWLFPEPNNPPVITPIPDATVTVGETFTYTVEATDPDEGNTLIFSLTTNPSTNMTINHSTGVISWTPNTTGDFEVTVEASDGELTDTQTFTITVSAPPNQAPVIALILDASVILGETFNYTVNATDPDGDDLTYSLTANPFTNMAIDQNSGVISWTPATIGSYEVTVEVSDGNESTTQSFTITVDKALLTSIEVLPSSMTLEIGESRIIDSVTAHYNNDTETLITPLSACTYDSNKSNATVSSDGVITGVSSCTASTPVTITVTYMEDSITQTDTVSVVVTNPSPG